MAGATTAGRTSAARTATCTGSRPARTATGAIYGVRLLETLYELGVEAHLIVSRWAEATIKTETERRPEDLRALAAVVYDEEDLAAPPASSAFETAGMIVAPCSMRTLAAVAN